MRVKAVRMVDSARWRGAVRLRDACFSDCSFVADVRCFFPPLIAEVVKRTAQNRVGFHFASFDTGLTDPVSPISAIDRR